MCRDDWRKVERAERIFGRRRVVPQVMMVVVGPGVELVVFLGDWGHVIRR